MTKIQIFTLLISLKNNNAHIFEHFLQSVDDLCYYTHRHNTVYVL